MMEKLKLKLLTDELQKNLKTHHGESKKFRLKGFDWFIWYDCPNECWCIQDPKGNTTDYSYIDDALELIISGEF